MNTDASLLSKVAALSRIAPFNRVRETELSLLAEVTMSRSYAPGAAVHAGGQPLARLLLVTGGGVRLPNGTLAGPVIGLGSIFEGAPAEALKADDRTGAEALWITKSAFFTLARECPELVRGFLELGPDGARLEPELPQGRE